MKIPNVKRATNFPQQQNNDELFKKIEQSAFVHIHEKIPRQPVAISIGTSLYKGNQYPIPYGSYGDYSAIVGSSKSRKTFLKTAIAAGYIGGRSNYFFPEIKGHDTSGKYVIDLDTEQSRYHSQLAFRRTIEMVGKDYPYYKPYALRTYSAKERIEFIDWLVYRSPYKGRIGLILIDGYADLIDNFNDIDQSAMLQDKLLNWSHDANCHITGVLHKNFGTEKPVGHIGSAVLKKAETVIFTEKKPEWSYTEIRCEYSRNMPFDKFELHINEDWLPTSQETLEFENI